MVTNTTRSSQPQQTLMDTNIKPQVAKECFDQHPRKIVDHGPIDRQRTLVNSNNYNLTPLQYWTPDQVETWLSNSRFKQLLPFLSGLNGSDLTHLNLKSLKSFGVESVITRVELLNDILLVKKQTSGNLARVEHVNTNRKVSNGSGDGIYTPLNLSPYLHLKDLSEYPVDHSKISLTRSDATTVLDENEGYRHSVFSISEYADNQAIDNEIGLNENIVQQKSKRSSVVIKQMDSFEKELNDMLLNLNRLESKHSGRVPVASLPKLPDRSSTVSKIPMSLDRPGIVNRNSASFMSKSIISSPRSSIISNSNSEKRRLTRSVSFADMEPIHKSLPAQSTLDRVFRLTKQEQISVPKTPESTKGEYMQVKIAGEMMFSKRFCVLIDNVLYILKKRDSSYAKLAVPIESAHNLNIHSRPNTVSIVGRGGASCLLSCNNQMDLVGWVNCLVKSVDPVKRGVLRPIKRPSLRTAQAE